MTTYYVRKSGNDSNNGTSPATAWLTIGKALGASGISSGDTVYIGSGIYREGITCSLTSPTAETFIIGDVLGQYTGDAPGEVRITNYLTDDKTPPTTQRLVTATNKDHLTFRNMMFQAGLGGSLASFILFDSCQYLTIEDCAFNLIDFSGNLADGISIIGDVDEPLHALINRCIFFTGGITFVIYISYASREPTASDVDCDVVVQNCLMTRSSGGVQLLGATSEASPYKAGGVIVKNCFLATSDSPCFSADNTSTAIPCEFYNNVALALWNSVAADVVGQITEDFNILIAQSPRLNVSTGSNSISDGSHAVLIHFGQELFNSQYVRPFGVPTITSPLLGFGSTGNPPSTDIWNRPRPAGGQSTLNAVGAYERHDTGIEDTSIYDSAPSSVKIVGPGDHDFELAVNPMPTNITIMARYDAAHSSGSPPQAQLLANPLIGLTSGSTLTMIEPVDTWEKLEFPTFEPTGYGVVTLRCISRSSSGSGNAWFDTITV